MRRDDRPCDESEGFSEIEAIESQWTRIWEDLGGPVGTTRRILRRDEFRIMWPYIRQLPLGSAIFDGGCGMGEWVLHLTRAGYPTYGLDVSKITIGKLREKFPEMDFAVGDIRETGLPENSFDAYFSWGTFEHFEEGFDRVVSEAFRIIKPGGLLFVSVPFDNLRHSIAANLSRPYRLPPQSNPTRFYQWRLTRAELALVLARRGFQVEDVKIIHKREGTARWLQHSFGLIPTNKATRALAAGFSLVLPGVLIGHMILSVARKPS
jgi:SAM-dependent methyltransferase